MFKILHLNYSSAFSKVLRIPQIVIMITEFQFNIIQCTLKYLHSFRTFILFSVQFGILNVSIDHS